MIKHVETLSIQMALKPGIAWNRMLRGQTIPLLVSTLLEKMPLFHLQISNTVLIFFCFFPQKPVIIFFSYVHCFNNIVKPKCKTAFSKLNKGHICCINSFYFLNMVYFLLSPSMLRKKPFSASKYAKDMLAYRKGTPCCFMQQTTALHEHVSKCCSVEFINELN